jgi:hypothetical protein
MISGSSKKKAEGENRPGGSTYRQRQRHQTLERKIGRERKRAKKGQGVGRGQQRVRCPGPESLQEFDHFF